MKRTITSLVGVIALTLGMTATMQAQAPSKTWNPNLKNGMYKNPVIDADYSDPDVCRRRLPASQDCKSSIAPTW